MSSYSTSEEQTYTCQECGAPLVEARTRKNSCVCLNQCGRIIDMPLPRKWKIRNHTKMALKLPDCYKSGRYFRIKGNEGVEYEQVGDPIRRVLLKRPPEAEGKLMAFDGFDILILEERH